MALQQRRISDEDKLQSLRGLVDSIAGEEAQVIIEEINQRVTSSLQNGLINQVQLIIETELLPLKELIKNDTEKRYLGMLIENIRLRIKDIECEHTMKAETGSINRYIARGLGKKGSSSLYFEASGRFKAKKRLGEGGMGEVYEVVDNENGAAVLALKTLHSNKTPQDIYDLKREFRSLEKLNHPNLIKYYEFFDEFGSCFFTMDKVEGMNFMDYVKDGAGKAASLETTIRVGEQNKNPKYVNYRKLNESLIQLVKGISYLHENNIIHRDIKPTNVLIQENGKLVLIDFGIVRKMELNGERSDSKSIKGTPIYMAPEQINDVENVTCAADWYAVGIMLYEALVGLPPLNDSNIYTLINQKNQTEPVPPHILNPTVPKSLSKLCTDLLQKDPEKRPKACDILTRLGEQPERLETEKNSFAAQISQKLPCIVRRAELNNLREIFEEMKKGEGQTVLVLGDLGIGKTKLINDFVSKKKKEDPEVISFSGACYEQENVQFKIFNGLMETVSNKLRNMSDQTASIYLPKNTDLLAQYFPVLKRVRVIANYPVSAKEFEPQELRKRLFRAVREFLDRLSFHHKLILVIDDLQWADAASFDLLKEILAPPEPPNMLLLMSSRQALTAEQQLPGHFQVMELKELESKSATRLVRKIFKNKEFRSTANVVAKIVEETGSPYYIQELTQYVINKGDKVIISLEEAIKARVKNLDTMERKLLYRICAYGKPLTQALASQIGNGEWQSNDFFRLVAKLRDERLVRTSGLRQNDSIEPYHDKVTQAVLCLLDSNRKEKKKVHEDIAKVLLETNQGDNQSLAVHFREAGDVDKAFEYSIKAAIEADRTLSFEEAAEFYENAIKLKPNYDLIGILYEKLADVLANQGNVREAMAAYSSVTRVTGNTDKLNIKISEVLIRCGRTEEAVEQLVKIFKKNKIKIYRSSKRTVPALLWKRMKLGLRGLKYQPVEEKEASKYKMRKIDILGNAVLELSMLKPLQANNYCQSMLLRALKLGEERRIGEALLLECMYCFAGGKYDSVKAAKIIKMLEEINEKLKTPYSHLILIMAQLVVAFGNGNFATSYEISKSAQKFTKEFKGVFWHKFYANFIQNSSLFWLGKYREMAETVPPLVNEAEQKGDQFTAVNFQLGLPSLYLLAQGKSKELDKQCGEVLSKKSADGYLQKYFLALSMAYSKLYQGKAKEALEVFAPQIAKIKRIKLGQSLPKNDLGGQFLQAQIALAIGGEEKLKVANKLGKQMLKEKTPWSKAVAKLILASVNYQNNKPIQGVIELLGQSVIELAELKMAGLEASAKYYLGKIKGDDFGNKLIQEALLWAQKEQIAEPEKLFYMNIPGLK